MGQTLLNGSRVQPPELTWNAIKPLLHEFGITRVGDITGLDRLGIPVWIAVRPNARTLSVSQGKGLTDTAAKVSAAMEALELAHAEQPELELAYATAGEMASSGRLVDLDALPVARHSVFGRNVVIGWTRAIELRTGEFVWVPCEIVNADARVERMVGAGSFLHTTNGLASGNTADEAVLHGLCEVIERDALALWMHTPPAAQAASRLNLATIDAPAAADVVQKMRSMEVEPIVWDLTSDVGIACIRVSIYDHTSDPVTRPLPVASGVGCHPDRTIALCRALTEAAQSRLTVIAGSRDDFGRQRYRETQSAEALDGFRRYALENTGSRRFDCIPHAKVESVSEGLELVLSRLEQADLKKILTVDLSRQGMPFSVVRTIVPGLEGPTESPSYLPGKRVIARVNGSCS
jgi:ribosomal protein S12 methylthiotransferase accessory factor